MSATRRVFNCILVLAFSASLVGCGGNSARVVEETEEHSFDEMAKQAADETALSEQEE